MEGTNTGLEYYEESEKSEEYIVLDSLGEGGDSEASNEDNLGLELGGSPVANLVSDSGDSDSEDGDYTEQCFKRRPRNFNWAFLPKPSKIGLMKDVNSSNILNEQSNAKSLDTSTDSINEEHENSFGPQQLMKKTSPAVQVSSEQILASTSGAFPEKVKCNSVSPQNPAPPSRGNSQQVPIKGPAAPKGTPAHGHEARSSNHTKHVRYNKVRKKRAITKIQTWIHSGHLDKAFKLLTSLQGKYYRPHIESALLLITEHAVNHKPKPYLDWALKLVFKWRLSDSEFCSRLISLCSQHRDIHIKNFLRQLIFWLLDRNVRLSMDAVMVLLSTFANGEFDLSNKSQAPSRSNASAEETNKRDDADKGSSPASGKKEVENIHCVLQNISSPSASLVQREVPTESNSLESGVSLDSGYLEKIKVYVEDDRWGRLRELLTYRGYENGESAMVEYIYKALCTQGNNAGNKFRSFVCMVTMNGKHELQPELLELLSQIGTSVIVECYASCNYEASVCVLSSLRDYHISYFTQEKFEASLGDNASRNVLFDHAAVLLAILDSCLRQKNRDLVMKVLKECNWGIPSIDGTNESKRKNFLQKRFELLTQLADHLLDERSLEDGSKVLKMALESLINDLDHPRPEENISRDINNLYNDYMEALVNTPELFSHLKELLDLYPKLPTVLQFDACVLRGLVAVLTRGHDASTAHCVFLEGCAKGIYCMPELPKNSFRFNLPIPNYFVQEEIVHTVQYFLHQLVPILREGRCTRQQLEVDISIQELPAPDIACVRILRLAQPTLEATRSRILGAMASFKPPLKLNPHISGSHYSIEPVSLEKYLEKRFNISFPQNAINFTHAPLCPLPPPPPPPPIFSSFSSFNANTSSVFPLPSPPRPPLFSTLPCPVQVEKSFARPTLINSGAYSDPNPHQLPNVCSGGLLPTPTSTASQNLAAPLRDSSEVAVDRSWPRRSRGLLPTPNVSPAQLQPRMYSLVNNSSNEASRNVVQKISIENTPSIKLRLTSTNHTHFNSSQDFRRARSPSKLYERNSSQVFKQNKKSFKRKSRSNKYKRSEGKRKVDSSTLCKNSLFLQSSLHDQEADRNWVREVVNQDRRMERSTSKSSDKQQVLAKLQASVTNNTTSNADENDLEVSSPLHKVAASLESIALANNVPPVTISRTTPIASVSASDNHPKPSSLAFDNVAASSSTNGASIPVSFADGQYPNVRREDDRKNAKTTSAKVVSTSSSNFVVPGSSGSKLPNAFATSTKVTVNVNGKRTLTRTVSALGNSSNEACKKACTAPPANQQTVKKLGRARILRRRGNFPTGGLTSRLQVLKLPVPTSLSNPGNCVVENSVQWLQKSQNLSNKESQSNPTNKSGTSRSLMKNLGPSNTTVVTKADQKDVTITVSHPAEAKITNFLKICFLSKHKESMSEKEIEEKVHNLCAKFTEEERKSRGNQLPLTLDKSLMKRLSVFAKQNI